MNNLKKVLTMIVIYVGAPIEPIRHPFRAILTTVVFFGIFAQFVMTLDYFEVSFFTTMVICGAMWAYGVDWSRVWSFLKWVATGEASSDGNYPSDSDRMT